MQTDASAAEIKKAFHKKSLIYHPDKNPDNPEAIKKFQRLTHIKTILCDPSKRSHYDRFGEQDLEEVDSGDEPEAEEGEDQEEEMDEEAFKELLKKFNKKNGNQTTGIWSF